MAKIRFAVVCDLCNQVGEQYLGGLTCDDCWRDVCPACAAKYDPDPPGSAVCKECQSIRGGGL